MCRTAKELCDYLRTLGGDAVDINTTVDKVIIGDPETPIKKIGTCWMPYLDVLQEAYAAGVNVMVCHEPTFYAHHDLEEELTQREFSKYYRWRGQTVGMDAYAKMVEEKKQWILDHEMVIIRCHDALDAAPEFGIPFALGRALGFGPEDLLRSKLYLHVYRMPSTTALQAAKLLAKKLRACGQDGVQFYGDPDRAVSSVAVGTGCYCDPIEVMELGADLYIAIDDAIQTWIQTTFAADSGQPMIVINHGGSEEPGVQLLSEHLKNVLPYPVQHFFCGCGYRWISAE